MPDQRAPVSMGTTILLLPSPYVGPSTWRPVASWLAGRGRAAQVVEVLEPPPDGLVAAVEAAARHDPVVLVPHSNAGLYVPHLSARVDVVAAVYVDAALAGTSPATALAPPEMLPMLRDLADAHDVLPPWTRWWDDADRLFPDDETRAAVESEQPRLPLAYATSTLPVPDRWHERPAAYLAFGDTYAAELAFARGCGWPTEVLDGGHLHQLHDPAAVGTAIVELLARITA